MSGVSAFEHGGILYTTSANKNIADILDFSANINPLGVSENIKSAIEDALKYIIHYPDTEAMLLKDAISSFYNVDKEYITVGNGAVEPIYILCHMLKPSRVLVTAPTFSEYERAALASGAEIDYFYLQAADDFKIDVQAMLEKIKQVDIVFIGNPNNPSGTLLKNHELELLIRAAKEYNTYVVVDESFIDFLPEAKVYTCRYLLQDYANLVIVHSLTKFYALPGLRLGFALANPQLTAMLHKGKDPWNVNSLAQAAGVAALKDSTYQAQTKAFIMQSKIDLFEKLAKVKNIVPFRPTVNFILVKLNDDIITSTELRYSMQKQGILIRDCSNYKGLSPAYIRLAVKTPEQHDILVNKLQQMVGGNL